MPNYADAAKDLVVLSRAFDLSKPGFADLLPAELKPQWKVGIQYNPISCAGHEAWLDTMIISARRLATNGLRATKSQDPVDKKLLDHFFNGATDADFVKTVFQSVVDILSNKNAFPVVIECKDLMNAWPAADTAAYILSDPKGRFLHADSLAIIVARVDKLRDHRPLPDPCDQGELANAATAFGGKQVELSQGFVLLHELFHIEYVAGPSTKEVGDVAYAPLAAYILRTKVNTYNLLTPEQLAMDPKTNADSFAVFGNWAYMLAMQRARRSLCQASYPLWNVFDVMDAVTASAQQPGGQQATPGSAGKDNKKVELRHLLAANLTDDDLQKEAVTAEDPVPCANDCALWTSLKLDTALPPNVPPDINYPGVADGVCPAAVVALCNFIDTGAMTPANQGVWLWGIGSNKGCLAGAFLPPINHGPYPTGNECKAIMNQMASKMNETASSRVGANLGAFPDAPTVKGFHWQTAAAEAVQNNGNSLDSSLASFVVTA